MDIEKFRNIEFEARTSCKVCGKLSDSPIIEMPDFPMTEIYTKELVHEKIAILDQGFCLCQRCGHGQLRNVIDVELQYGSTFSYHFRTSQSATGRESAEFFINFINGVAGEDHFKNIVEIGCNDLYILRALKQRADRLIGIDPILKGREEEFSDDKITAIGEFFESVSLDCSADMVICKDALEHVSDPKGLVERVVDKATNDALFLFQFPLLETLLEGCRIDHIFHQHLNYFSIQSIHYMLDELGCELMSYTINKDHWGAILIAFRRKKARTNITRNIWKITQDDILDRYSVFEKNMEATVKRLSFFENENIYGYGAALMLPVLAYHLGTDFSCLKCVIDDDKSKEGLYYINLPVSICHRERITDIQESVVLVTAIASVNNTRRILMKLWELGPKQIILPLNTL